MPITINYVVIHKLNKEKSEPIKVSDIRETLLPKDNESVITLIENVSKLYGRKNNSAQFGVFESGEARGIFPDCFCDYYENQKTDDDDFHALSVTTMNSLYSKAEGVPFATGGYIVFADYINEKGSRYFLVAMIKQKDGVTISDGLNIESLEYIDDSKLYQAARINFDKYLEYINLPPIEQHDLNYLSFVSPRGTNAGYFVSALGCKAGAPSAKATKAVVSETVAFFRENKSLAKNSTNVKTDLITYLNEIDSSDKPRTAKLSEVEQIARKYFPADNEEIADKLANELYTKLNSEDVGIPFEFNVNKGALKKITNIKFKGDFIIDFNKNDLGTSAENKFRYHNNTLIIKDLPDDLIAQITEQLAEADT